jgi:glycosyltransferase involved in cell wall biosynthesis
LPNFVPTQEEALLSIDETNSDRPDRPYFLFVGRLEKLKGLQTLIPIFCSYQKAQLRIAGAGSYEPQLRRLAKGARNIEFLGQLSGQQLQSLYRKAVAVIAPSLCFEVFPQVLIEAFQQQTPVIVRNLGGMSEIIEESNGGLLYQSDEELVTAMDRLLENTSDRQQLGAHGYQAYQQNWTTELHLQRYFALIDEIAARRGLLLG